MRGTCFTTVGLICLVIGRLSIAHADETNEKRETVPAAMSVVETPISDYDRTHWAYRPLQPVEIPKNAASDWERTPIDAFILRRLAEEQLSGAPETDRATWLRRVTYGLTGLPPTPAELSAFLQDKTPDARERQVDRLLNGTTYGERMAQPWLDLARFAETDGFEHDKVRGDAWKYRDWVISAFNSDLSFADFLRAQLAGDLIHPEEWTVATMFGLAGPDMPDVNDQAERRHFRMNELTATVGSVFLAMQVGCAECHDHKYDPISQADFYRLRAVFESAVPVMQRDKPYLLLRQQPTPLEARLWIRGDHRRPGPLVAPSLPRVVIPNEGGRTWETFLNSTGPRRALAEAFVTDAAVLTSRVIVNRVWQQHFVRGLCETPSDFGMINTEPVHLELLDWLACGFMEHDWSLKWLHRQIVLSATYAQTSRQLPIDPAWQRRLEKDADFRLLSRSPRRRLDGEQLRDALLAVGGQLHYEQGGPGVRPPLPEELVSTLLKNQWVTTDKERHHRRRSIYLFARRNLRFPLLEAFDRPDLNVSCATRGQSTTAPQALALMNSELSLRTARLLADEVLACSDDERARHLFLKTLARDPSDDERRLIANFIQCHAAALLKEAMLAETTESTLSKKDAENEAWCDLCLAMLNCSEFLYLD